MRSVLLSVGRICLAVVMLFGLSSVTMAWQEDINLENQWHQWRGPSANGVAPHATPATTWSETSNIAWKVPIAGEGISTPIVWGDKVFVLTAVATDRVPESAPVKDERAMTRPPNQFFQFKVICLSLETGETIWEDVCAELVPHEGRHKTSTYAAASPMTDGQQLIVPFGSFGIFSYSLDGEKKWSIDLGDMHTRKGWGEATSPVLVDGLVIMNWDNEDESFIYAIDASNGETNWKIARDEPTTWATPLIIKRDGKQQVVTNGTNSVMAYDLQTGEEVWRASGTTLNAIPCPVEFGENVIFMAGYRGNRAVSIKIGSNSELTETWERTKSTPYVPSPLLSGNRLYFTQANVAILTCVNAETGEPFFGPQRLQGLESLYGSPVMANDRVYLTSRDGVTVVFKDAETFEVLATNQLDDSFDASPVPVGNRLLLRGKKSLYCIQVKP